MGSRYLAIYLQDHLAGATAGLELAKRVRDANRGKDIAPFLEGLAREIDEDRATLRDLMRGLGIPASSLKNSAGWLAEKLGRLKLNGQLAGYSPLSRLEELEALRAGVQAKLAMWRTLRRVRPRVPELEDVDLDGLIERGERQAGQLDELHARAAEQVVPNP